MKTLPMRIGGPHGWRASSAGCCCSAIASWSVVRNTGAEARPSMNSELVESIHISISTGRTLSTSDRPVPPPGWRLSCGACSSCSRARPPRGASRSDASTYLLSSKIERELICSIWPCAQEEADVGVAAVLSCYRGLREQAANADKCVAFSVYCFIAVLGTSPRKLTWPMCMPTETTASSSRLLSPPSRSRSSSSRRRTSRTKWRRRFELLTPRSAGSNCAGCALTPVSL